MDSRLRDIGRDFMQLGKLWPHLQKQRKLIYLAIALIPIVSLLQMSIPFILKLSIDSGIAKSDENVILKGSGLFLAAVVFEYLVRAVQRMATSLAVYRMIKSLRKRLVSHVLGLSCSYHDRSLSGRLVTRATSDFDNLSESLNQGVLGSVIDISVLIGSAIGLILLDWRLALCLIVILPLMGGIITWFSSALKRAMLKARQKIAVLNAFTQECLYGAVTVKLLSGEKDAQVRYDKMGIEYRDAQMKTVILDAWMFALIDGMASVTTGVILWFAVSPFLSGTELTAGILVASVQYIHQLYEPLKFLGSKMAMLQGAFTAMERIFEVLKVEDRVEGNQPVGSLVGRVELKKVSFRYRKKEENQVTLGPWILRDMDLTFKNGESVAIVGATGGGKSTIIKLITKLYDGYEGQILVDGRDLRGLSGAELRTGMAVVPQDIALFDGTVEFNVGLKRPGVTRERVEKACREIGADRFIQRLPNGYDFHIREQGGNLSQGQRQLLTFARALASEPSLVVLDEATSSVDPQSEALVQEAISRLLQGRTVIVIAHRLSTIRRCDRIVVVEGGDIVQEGTHSELMDQAGKYRQLHEALN